MTVSILEKESVLRSLQSGIRLDGRKLSEFRKTFFEFSSKSRGHVSVSLGNTRVLAVATAELDRPYVDRPFEGQLSFFVEYSATALNSNGFSTVGTKMDEDQFGGFLQRTLERAFKTGRAIDLESLCVITGQRAWNVRVDIHILDDDGNVLDAVLLSALAALTDFRRPDVEISAENEVKIFSSFERHPVPLSFHHYPLSVSFALFASESGSSCTKLVDPTSLETLVQSTSVSIIMNRQGEIVHFVKPGGAAVDSSFILEEILPESKSMVVELSNLVSSSVSSRVVPTLN